MSTDSADSPPAHLRTRGSMEAGNRELDYPELPEPLSVGVYDNHAHLEIADGENPLDFRQHLARAESVGVKGVVQVGTNVATSRWSADIADIDSRVLAAVAIHPNEAPDLQQQCELDDALHLIDQLAARNRVVAVGETGLDYFRTEPPMQQWQRMSFIEHIRIAKRHNIALQIHDRDAHADVVEVLLSEGAPERTVFHCFSGDTQLAEIINRHGWYASFAGTVTFKNAVGIQQALTTLEPSRLLIETDTPFLTPVPHRGKPNSPYLIPHTLRFMANLLGVDEKSLAESLTQNTHRVYGRWDDHPVSSTPMNHQGSTPGLEPSSFHAP